MAYNRRLFLKNTGMLASGIALAGLGCESSGNKENKPQAGVKDADSAASNAAVEQSLAQFGLQLYTLRDDLPKDPKGVLKQVADFGYKQLEGYEGNMGLFWGMSNTEFKKYLDGLGLTLISSHCNIEKDFEKKAAESAAIGMKYLICPSIGKQKKLDDYKKYADKFNTLGDICKKNGLKFAYHNHGYTFTESRGQYPQDILMQNTNPETVDFEMDIYWVIVPGADPVAWLQKYPNRFKLCHIKDRLKTARPGEEDASTEVGAGSIDFKKILSAAQKTGMEYYIVEQEKYDNSTPLKSVEASANYLKTFTF